AYDPLRLGPCLVRQDTQSNPIGLVSFCKKNGPRVHGGQVALVLSRCESFFGGLRRGGRWRECRASGEELAAYYGCSAPAAAGALWGDAAAWAAKLFSI